MSIEQEYLDKIEEIKQNDDKLTAWEKGFIYGDSDSTPIDTRPGLSISQKSIVDRIYDQRVTGADKKPITEIKFANKSDRVVANKTETNQFAVSVDDNVIGPKVSQREATAVVGFLAECIDDMMPITAEATADAPF